MVRVVIVEDQPDVLSALTEALSLNPEIWITETFGTAEDFVEKLPQTPAEVVLMDISLPGMSGLQAVAACKSRFPQIQFMMWTAHDDDDHVFEALCAGATGYLLKKSPLPAIVQAIFDIHQGGSPMSPAIARKVISSFQNQSVAQAEMQRLSNREREILKLVADGMKYREIADALFISLETVRTHVRHIYEKLHVESRSEMLKKLFPHRQVI